MNKFRIRYLWNRDSHRGNHIVLVNNETNEYLYINGLASDPLNLQYTAYG